jgi:hypothetical protein
VKDAQSSTVKIGVLALLATRMVRNGSIEAWWRLDIL